MCKYVIICKNYVLIKDTSQLFNEYCRPDTAASHLMKHTSLLNNNNNNNTVCKYVIICIQLCFNQGHITTFQ